MCVPANMVWKSVRTYHAETSIFQLRGNQRNQPQGKSSQYDGSVIPRGTPWPINWKVGRGQIISEIRRPENLWRHDCVKRNHPSRANGDFQQQNPRVETTILRPQVVGKRKIVLSPNAHRSEKSGNSRRKRGVRRDSAKLLRCTTSPFRRAPWGDIINSNNRTRNAKTRLRSERTGTS